MEALRIVLKQNSANYKKEETSLNKMTYPLPPFSTVIGAIHNACGYKEYKPMDISIQGNYESLTLEPYTDYCFLNSVMDDRGILVRFKNSNSLSRSYEKVAKALKSTGNSFEKCITIQVFNEDILNEYRDLKNLSKKISGDLKRERDEKLKIVKEAKSIIAEKKKELKDDKLALEEIKKQEAELKIKEKNIKNEFEKFKEENFTKPYSRFASLTTSVKYYETLNNINLIIHIKSDKDILLDIEKNIYNLKSIGRSEDFVEIIEAKMVNLLDTVQDQDEIINKNSAYIDFNLVKEEVINPTRYSDNKNCSGTKYYLNKDYNIVNKKRVFNKKKVLFISEYSVDEEAENIYFDIDDLNKYIVNFI